ncbi:MAG TPA: transposase, partial [Pilimelia sp.]|nr:transposase [Pilimelia sp.]
PPGITPIVPQQRTGVPPAEAGEPFRAPLTTAAINSARAERQRGRGGEPPRSPVEEPPPPGVGAAEVSIPVPLKRPASEPAGSPGSRANWPLSPSREDRAAAAGDRDAAGGRPAAPDRTPRIDEGRVTPPWQADDLPPEPPALRLVEPPAADRRPADRDPLGDPPLDRAEPVALRLVDGDTGGRAAKARRAAERDPLPPASETDGDLLIFAAARSAWFIAHDEEEAAAEREWSTSADRGWRAAEQAARPAVGAETSAGLPRRVPQANLVPGSPLREERPLRIVRDPASIAAHTTGYFRGWRRGQEIGGYAVGGRPGRESAGGWDFSRDHEGQDDSGDYPYRSAGYRS